MVTLKSTAASFLLASAAFAQPIITTLIAPKGPTGGGDLIYIGGTFPAGTPTVRIGGNTATVQTFTSSYILCRTPAGTGANKPVQVIIANSPGNSVPYTYDSPRVTGISPSTGTTAGNIQVQIVGENFGPNCVVTIGNRIASVIGTPTSTSINCMLPAGQGADLPISVTVDGQTSPLSSVSFAYSAPSISSIDPLTGASNGGNIVTVLGSNFGLTPTVKAGDTVVTPIPGTITPTSLQFRMPAGAGIVPVKVIVANFESAPRNYTYATPSIDAILPPHGPTTGGTTIEITGDSFGPASTATILFNGLPVPVSPDSLGHSSLKFVLPEGMGTHKSIQVINGNQPSNVSTDFRFDSPDIAGVTPLRMSSSGGEYFVIHGTNFGPNPLVFMEGQVVPVVVHSHATITCVALAGSVGTHSVTVVAQDQNDTDSSLHYSCEGDFNHDGRIDFFDYLDFVDAFSLGC